MPPLRVGDRVRLNAKTWADETPQRLALRGSVVAIMRDGTPRVLWDGLKYPQEFVAYYLEKIEEEKG